VHIQLKILLAASLVNTERKHSLYTTTKTTKMFGGSRRSV